MDAIDLVRYGSVLRLGSGGYPRFGNGLYESVMLGGYPRLEGCLLY